MTSLEKNPTFNLGAVVQETGVKADTLRAWERRYGLPEPVRSSGRHRLYSQYDIEVVKWLVARQDEGMSIGRSVKLWRSIEEQGKEPLGEFQPVVPQLNGSGVSRNALDVAGIRASWIRACLEFNERAAEQILSQAFALYPPITVCLEVLQQGLAEIGQQWYQNQVTVQQEHFASALAMRRLNALVSAAPSPSRPGRIILGCPAAENHVFVPLLLTLMLRYNGWEVIYLGADVPLARLETTIQSVKPDLIIMTAQQLHTAATLKQVAEFAAKAQVPLGFGGRIFNLVPKLREQIPGFFLGEKLEDVKEGVAKVMTSGYLPPASPPTSPDYQQAQHVYRQRQAAIESHVWELLQGTGADYEHITNANLFLSRDIIAALSLGDMSLLGNEISWTEKLLLNYAMPVASLQAYLQTYFQAASQELPQEGQPIVDWLGRVNDDLN